MYIRQYQASDQEQIDSIQVESQESLKASTPAGYFDDLSNIPTSYSGGTFLIAEVEGQVVGFGGLLSTGELVRMRVRQQSRRQGIASQLLTELTTFARQLGMTSVYLYTLEEQLSAQALYKHFGFRETERVELFGNKVIRYELPLVQDEEQPVVATDSSTASHLFHQ